MIGAGEPSRYLADIVHSLGYQVLVCDPRLDDMALLEALQSPAFYVGALGPRALFWDGLERNRW